MFNQATARSSVVSRIAHQSLYNSPRIMPSQPWWYNLESNFSSRPEGFDLGLRDELRVGATAAFDYALRTSASALVGLTAVPSGYHPLRLWKQLRAAEFYKPIAERYDSTAFFAEPPRNVTVTTKRARLPLFRPKDGVCEDLRFQSPFVPVNPSQRKDYLKHKMNRVAHARLWRHNGGPRPTIAAIHGFGADQMWLNEWFFALKHYYQIGCNVLLFTLPFHGPRQTRFSPFSGYGFFAGGVCGTNEAFAQAIFDFRIFMNFLEDSYKIDKIGVTGISLGGLTTALLASTEKRLAFAVPNVPVSSIADLILEWMPVGAILRSMLFATRRSIKDIRHMLATSTPLTYRPKLDRERLMIIGGVGDRLAPPKHSRILWDHWDRCTIHWFPGSHVIHLDKGEYLKHMATFMKKIGFLDDDGFAR